MTQPMLCESITVKDGVVSLSLDEWERFITQNALRGAGITDLKTFSAETAAIVEKLTNENQILRTIYDAVDAQQIHSDAITPRRVQEAFEIAERKLNYYGEFK